MKKLVLIISVLLSVNAFAGGGSSIGPGNPATLNCDQLGGVTESFQNSNGEDANCVIEEWLLFREMTARGLTQSHRYGEGAMPNPAAVNCADIGGDSRVVETREGQTGFCVVGQWALFRVINVISRP